MFCPYKGNFGAILGKKVFVKEKQSFIEGIVIMYDYKNYNVKCIDGKFRKVHDVYIRKDGEDY